jgi:hypothetical protein
MKYFLERTLFSTHADEDFFTILVFMTNSDVCSSPLTNRPLVHPQMEYWCGWSRWNDNNKENTKNSEKNLSQYNCVHHKFHMD